MSEKIQKSLEDLMSEDFKPTVESMAFDKKRTKDNEELIKLLAKLSKEQPSLRFSQLLQNYGFVNSIEVNKSKYWDNEFYSEPGQVLKRVQDNLKARS